MSGSWISKVIPLACACLLVAGCNGPTHPTALGEAAGALQAAPSDAGSTGVVGTPLSPSVDRGQPVLTFAAFDQVGTSQLVRTPTGVNVNLSTSALEPGHAYTLWIVIFNKPSLCQEASPISACGPSDVGNAAAEPDMMYAAGAIAGGAGRATFAGRRQVGDLTGSINAPVHVPAYGLLSPFGAEIHLVVHDHGPKLAQFLPDMIQTVAGGCMNAGIGAAPWDDYGGPEFGRRGPNTCQSIQFAVHRASDAP